MDVSFLSFLIWPVLIRAQTVENFVTDVYAKEIFYSAKPVLEDGTAFSVLFEFSNVIVDKTLLIKRMLECDKKAIIVSLPRGFGKTTAMEMMKAFFEIQVDEWANEILPKNSTSNYKMFVEGVYVSDNEAEVHSFGTSMLIANHMEILEQFQGQRAVIHLRFERSIDIVYKEFFLEIRKVIRKSFMEHEYLLNRFKDIFFFKNGTEEEIKVAKSKMDLFNDRICLDKDESAVIDSIYALSEILAEFFDRPVVIMIDEYDHFILQVFKWVLDSPDGFKYRNIQTEKRVLEFFRKWFDRILNQNVFCEKAFLNGRTLFCRDQIFTNFEDYLAIDAFTNPFHEYYGFTEREVEKLLELTEVPRESWEEVKLWYYGYNLNIFADLTVYNQLDIAGFLANQRVSNYWENEYALLYGRDIRRLFQFEPLRDFYTRLILNGALELPLTDLKLDQAEKTRLGNLLAAEEHNFEMGDDNSMLIIKELSVAGYLTNDGLSENGNVMIRFANRECASVCGRILNVSMGSYSWLNDSTLFRFAPEYYDELERLKEGIRTRRPNLIIETSSRAPKWKKSTTRGSDIVISSRLYPKSRRSKKANVRYD